MLMQDFAAGLAYKALPEDVLQVLRRSLLDTLGVAAIGSRSKMAQIGTKAARMMFGATTESSARCLFDGNNASAAGAAMAGAMAIDSVDAHDGTSACKGHAGSAIFPALFAMVDNRTITGQDLATYLALAYEISYRAGLTQHDTCADFTPLALGPQSGSQLCQRGYWDAVRGKFMKQPGLENTTAPEAR
mgnify:CR=1 FL=1